MENVIKFVEPTANHNNFGIMFFGEPDFIEMARGLCNREFTTQFVDDPRRDEKKSWEGFQQGHAEDWLYWEFWHEQTPRFRKQVEEKIRWFQRELIAILNI